MTKQNELFQEWVRYADEDLRIIEIALREDGPPNQICFHAQQVGEKYLKAFLIFNNQEIEKSHQLRYLLDLCQLLDSSFNDNELRDDVIYLTQFYIETRYPGDIPAFSIKEARLAFEAAVRIKEFVSDKVK